jgi:hypothetical protein
MRSTDVRYGQHKALYQHTECRTGGISGATPYARVQRSRHHRGQSGKEQTPVMELGFGKLTRLHTFMRAIPQRMLPLLRWLALDIVCSTVISSGAACRGMLRSLLKIQKRQNGVEVRYVLRMPCAMKTECWGVSWDWKGCRFRPMKPA